MRQVATARVELTRRRTGVQATLQICCFVHTVLIRKEKYFFSCASAKAERSLSSLSCVCVYVDQNKGTLPPSQDFMGPYQNATPLLYDSKFAHDQKDPPPQLNCHGCIW